MLYVNYMDDDAIISFVLISWNSKLSQNKLIVYEQ